MSLDPRLLPLAGLGLLALVQSRRGSLARLIQRSKSSADSVWPFAGDLSVVDPGDWTGTSAPAQWYALYDDGVSEIVAYFREEFDALAVARGPDSFLLVKRKLVIRGPNPHGQHIVAAETPNGDRMVAITPRLDIAEFILSMLLET